MDKRYQIFVSSTFTDLIEERQSVIQTLMSMDCIPSGMELFPAADEEQFEFIKKVINDCDYYLLIIGGRYGSVTSEGLSYTEKEYDYAVSKGIRVIAMIHGKPDEIPTGKSETDPKLRKKLNAFRDKVAKIRLIKFWTTTSELPGLVALAVMNAIKMFPAVGWARADQVADIQSLTRATSDVTHGTLNKCFEIVEKEVKLIRHLRIYANGTTSIQPLFSNSGISVIKCEILLRKLRKDESERDFADHLKHMMKQWEELKKRGRINQLEFKRHQAIPTEWQIIFDNNFLISGLNIPEKNDWLGIDVLEPILITDHSIESKLLINKYIQRFDGFYNLSSL